MTARLPHQSQSSQLPVVLVFEKFVQVSTLGMALDEKVWNSAEGDWAVNNISLTSLPAVVGKTRVSGAGGKVYWPNWSLFPYYGLPGGLLLPYAAGRRTEIPLALFKPVGLSCRALVQ